MIWTPEDEAFLQAHYPERGKGWCAEQLKRTPASVRGKAAVLGLRQSREGPHFDEWQSRAAASKVGKKRPAQAEVIRGLQAAGKLDKTLAQRQKLSASLKAHFAGNPHPRGMLGKSHGPAAKAKIGARAANTWRLMTEEQILARSEKIMRTRAARGIVALPRPGASWKAGWREVGGERIYFRSRWEANYARYLEWLRARGEIAKWEHEPETFWFPVKRGCVSYLPDFRVTNKGGSLEYHEVKGWMDARSQTKIKRMAIHHPAVRLFVIAERAYKKIERDVSGLIPEWEKAA